MQQAERSFFAPGVLLALFGAFGFSVKAILARLAYRDAAAAGVALDAITLITLRVVLSVPFFLAMVWLGSRRAESRLTQRDWIQIAVLGFIGYYLASFLDFWGLEYITAALERIILFTYPGFVLLMNAAFFQQRVRRLDLLALSLAFAGIFVAFWNDLHLGQDASQTILGSALVLGASITYASYLIGTSRLVPRIGSLRLTGMVVSLSTFYIVGHFLLTHPVRALQLPAQIYWYGVLLALLSTVLPIYATAEAIRHIGANRVSLIGFIGPIATIALGHWLLNEHITPLQITGMAMVMGGVAMVSTGKSAKRTSEEKT